MIQRFILLKKLSRKRKRFAQFLPVINFTIWKYNKNMAHAVWQAMYFTIFNQVTDTIRQMEQQIRTLKQLQLQMEQQYIEQKNQHISYTICKDFPARRNDHFL